MTQAQLARAIEQQPSAVGNVLAGRNDPSLATLRRVMAALGVSEAYFWGAYVPEPAQGTPGDAA